MRNNYNLDASETIFFERELEELKSRSYDVLYAPLASTRLIPVDNTTFSGATSVTYTQYDKTGSTNIIANYSDDLPLCDVRGKQITSNLVSIGNAFEISIQDIRASVFAGKSLEQRKANSAAKAHLDRMNQIAFYGEPSLNVNGWLNNSSLGRDTSNESVSNRTNTNPAIRPATGADSNIDTKKVWENKTPTEILDDLNDAVTDIHDASNGVEYPDTIAMPISRYQLIANTQMSPGSDTTIMQFFVRNNPSITIEWANELKGAFNVPAGGLVNRGVDGFIVYTRSADKFWQEIPQAFEMFPPQFNNLAYKVPCHSKHGGVIIAYPGSQAFRYGI